jgi:hypothetical protein
MDFSRSLTDELSKAEKSALRVAWKKYKDQHGGQNLSRLEQINLIDGLKKIYLSTFTVAKPIAAVVERRKNKEIIFKFGMEDISDIGLSPNKKKRI